jgi:hypothetical protein
MREGWSFPYVFLRMAGRGEDAETYSPFTPAHLDLKSRRRYPRHRQAGQASWDDVEDAPTPEATVPPDGAAPRPSLREASSRPSALPKNYARLWSYPWPNGRPAIAWCHAGPLQADPSAQSASNIRLRRCLERGGWPLPRCALLRSCLLHWTAATVPEWLCLSVRAFGLSRPGTQDSVHLFTCSTKYVLRIRTALAR